MIWGGGGGGGGGGGQVGGGGAGRGKIKSDDHGCTHYTVRSIYPKRRRVA